jgi:hypothetical protein
LVFTKSVKSKMTEAPQRRRDTEKITEIKLSYKLKTIYSRSSLILCVSVANH